MPVYEYVCTSCGHPVEVMHSFTAQGPQECERCGAPMRKALSTPAIVFKGSGWAKKDHRDKVHASSKASTALATATAAKADGDSAATAAVAADGGSATTAPAADTAGRPAPSTTPATAPAAKPPTATMASKSSAANSD